jgi:hypothetical protein
METYPGIPWQILFRKKQPDNLVAETGVNKSDWSVKRI